MQQTAIEVEPLSVAGGREVTGYAGFVPVAFTSDRADAEKLLTLFERHDIPGMINAGPLGDEVLGELDRGVPVLVPADLHDFATALMARDDDEDDDDLYDDDDDEFEDDDLDDLDDLDDDFDEDEDDDFDPDIDEEEDVD